MSLDSGQAYVCGPSGTLLRGRGNAWQALDLGGFHDGIQSLAWYDGALYLSTLDSVFRLDDRSLRIVRSPADGAGTCLHLSARDGVLWSIGAKDIASFDGSRWTQIE